MNLYLNRECIGTYLAEDHDEVSGEKICVSWSPLTYFIMKTQPHELSLEALRCQPYDDSKLKKA